MIAAKPAACYRLCVLLLRGLSAALILVLFFLSAVSARPAENVPAPSLSGLQKAVGNDWIVTATGDGYLVTYAHPVRFQSTRSQCSKDHVASRGSQELNDRLQIKIVRASSLNQELHYNPLRFAKPEAENASHYYLCFNSDSDLVPEPAFTFDSIWFLTNYSPDDSIFPREADDAYDQAVYKLAARFYRPRLVIED